MKYSEAEKLIHHYIERFTNLRIRNNREFFNVAPEEALAIFKEVALLLDDAEIDEVFKNVVVGKMTQNTTEKAATLRKEANTWILPANKKFFDIDACVAKLRIELNRISPDFIGLQSAYICRIDNFE